MGVFDFVEGVATFQMSPSEGQDVPGARQFVWRISKHASMTTVVCVAFCLYSEGFFKLCLSVQIHTEPWVFTPCLFHLLVTTVQVSARVFFFATDFSGIVLPCGMILCSLDWGGGRCVEYHQISTQKLLFVIWLVFLFNVA